ncbi:kinase-like protein [Ramaria rubella]|nr:kinase-like protein [Ramaria rubella]
MSSTAVLRTPPASTSSRSDFISLRPPRGAKEKDFRCENSPSPRISPTTFVSTHRFKSPPERSFGDSPSQPSPSPLRKRVLFERGGNGQCDSDEEEEPSPSLNRLHSPFASRCASPFLGAWATHSPKVAPNNQPVEDDEGLFLTSKPITTPTCTPTRAPNHSAVPWNPGSVANHQTVTAGASGLSKVILTPSAPRKHTFIALSPLHSSRPRIPQTPAETEWHLGRQAESMTKLSLDDDENLLGSYKLNHRISNVFKEPESSPSPISRRRGRKRSFDGAELPRARGEIFETSTDTPIVSSFHIPDFPSPATKLKCSATAFFGPPIRNSPAPSTKPPMLSVSTPSDAVARSRNSSPKVALGSIAKKYRPRDSGVSGLDDEEIGDAVGPLAMKSVVESSSLGDNSSGLITPGLEPLNRSAWPQTTFAESQQGEVDEFIFKALAAGGAAPKDKKVMPGTPVKRNAYAYSRPWMSSSKVMPPPAIPRAIGAPRKSLPLSFPNLAAIHNSPEGSDTSPSERSLARKAYGDVGKGRPSMSLSRGGAHPDNKMRLLLRRSSSGAFSSSSSSDDSRIGTPTKATVPACRLPSLHPSNLTPQTRDTPMKRPPFNRHNAYELSYRPSPRPSFGIFPRPLTEHECPGKFELEFLTVDVLGTGEFGSALKVRHKQGSEQDVFAVKKSKVFEGVRHRHRLREEVDVLQHLVRIGEPRGHPNVLKYIDSWEQDDALYIQTELCDLGNFGNFLTEYGAHFEALDEARVWKICAELSDGLKFVHDAGIIHLDLKPANIFVTNEGRFKIGDFGMASFWPRPAGDEGFEREGDREYMAPEVLQGRYGPEADMFSFGMIMLETTANIVVPDMGDEWHRLREDDFSAVDFESTGSSALIQPRSTELVHLITYMMRSDPDARIRVEQVYNHRVVRRARESMMRKLAVATANGTPVFGASPLGGESETYVEEVLQIGRSGKCNTMDLSP